MTTQELQDELEAIRAIYPDTISEVVPQVFNLKIPNHEYLTIQMSFPDIYPEQRPSLVQIFADDNRFFDIGYLERNFQELLLNTFHVGEVVIFELFANLEEFLEVYEKDHQNTQEQAATQKLVSLDESVINSLAAEELMPVVDLDPFKGWIQSDTITDRGSTFIGFSREVHSVEEAVRYIELLATDKKIARATHNMTAWRIRKDNGIQFQDCDDDGETAAGSRMLHLLTVCLKLDLFGILLTAADDGCVECRGCGQPVVWWRAFGPRSVQAY